MMFTWEGALLCHRCLAAVDLHTKPQPFGAMHHGVCDRCRRTNPLEAATSSHSGQGERVMNPDEIQAEADEMIAEIDDACAEVRAQRDEWKAKALSSIKDNGRAATVLQDVLRERDEARAEVQKWQSAARTADGVMRSIEAERDAYRDALAPLVDAAERVSALLPADSDTRIAAIGYVEVQVARAREALAAGEEES